MSRYSRSSGVGLYYRAGSNTRNDGGYHGTTFNGVDVTQLQADFNALETALAAFTPHIVDQLNNIGEVILITAADWLRVSEQDQDTKQASDVKFASVQISGDLSVAGTMTTLNTSNMEVKDPLFKIADGNVGDAIDLGYYAQYQPAAVVTYGGMVRDASRNRMIFYATEEEPTTTVNTSAASFVYTDIQTKIAYAEQLVASVSISAPNFTSLENKVNNIELTLDELENLTPAEILQLENINLTTISATQWAYLGASNQGFATTDSPHFYNLFADNGLVYGKGTWLELYSTPNGAGSGARILLFGNNFLGNAFYSDCGSYNFRSLTGGATWLSISTAGDTTVHGELKCLDDCTVGGIFYAEGNAILNAVTRYEVAASTIVTQSCIRDAVEASLTGFPATNDDYVVRNSTASGDLLLQTNGANTRLEITSAGVVTVKQNLVVDGASDFKDDIKVTGDISLTGVVDGIDVAAIGALVNSMTFTPKTTIEGVFADLSSNIYNDGGGTDDPDYFLYIDYVSFQVNGYVLISGNLRYTVKSAGTLAYISATFPYNVEFVHGTLSSWAGGAVRICGSVFGKDVRGSGGDNELRFQINYLDNPSAHALYDQITFIAFGKQT